MNLRFKKIDEDRSQAVVPGHTITRELAYFRLGGWTYEFSCSCGWHGFAEHYKPKSNEVARRHLDEEGWGEK